MSTNLIGQIAKEFVTGANAEVSDIVTFVEAPWGLGVKLKPVQKYLCKCYYGLPLEDKEKCIRVPDMFNERTLFHFTEKEFQHWLYEEGRCNTKETEGKMSPELLLILGRRGCKTTTASFIADYELYKLIRRKDPSLYFGFPPMTDIYILCVAPTDEQAKLAFDMTQSLASRCPYLKDRFLHQTMDYFDMQTDVDMEWRKQKPKASLVVMAGGCSSNGLRGRNSVVVIMDELAFFVDNGGRFSGDQVYNAVTPSVADFKGEGRVLCLTSPYGKFGKAYNLYQESFRMPERTLMFKMYSSLVNDTLTPAWLRSEYKKGKGYFMREYGAEFADTISNWVEDEREFRKCITISAKPSRGIVETPYFMGVDVGFKNDGMAYAVAHYEEKGNKICLDVADVWFSRQSDVWQIENGIYRDCKKYAGMDLLRMSDLVQEIRDIHRWFPIKKGIFDQYDGYALAEVLNAEGFKQFEMQHFSDLLNAKLFELVKRLYVEGLLELYDHPVLVPEILAMEEECADKVSKVRAPTRLGAHDDIVTAFVRAVWLCYHYHQENRPNVSIGAAGVLSGGVGALKVAASQRAFNYQRLRIHGDHPRTPYVTRRSMSGARV